MGMQDQRARSLLQAVVAIGKLIGVRREDGKEKAKENRTHRCPDAGLSTAKFYEEMLAGRENLSGDPEPRPDRTELSPEDRKSLYLAHMSLPAKRSGYTVRTQSLIEALAGQGWDATVVSRPGYLEDLGVLSETQKVGNEFSRRRWNGIWYQDLPRQGPHPNHDLRKYLYDYTEATLELADTTNAVLIHGASKSWNGWAAVNAATRANVPSIYELRGLWMLTRASREPDYYASRSFAAEIALEMEVVDKASKVLVISERLERLLVDWGADATKIEVIPNGVSVGAFSGISDDEKQSTLQSLGLESKFVVGYIGTLLDYEGLSLLVDAFAIAKTQFPEMHLLFVGSGPEEDNIRARIAQLDCENTTTFVGEVPPRDIPRLYSVIDCAPFPRFRWPVTDVIPPLKPFEALAAGCRVVTSDCLVFRDLRADGAPISLCPAGDAEALAAWILAFAEESQAETILRRQEAIKWVSENRSWKTIGGRLSGIYRSLTEPTSTELSKS